MQASDDWLEWWRQCGPVWVLSDYPLVTLSLIGAGGAPQRVCTPASRRSAEDWLLLASGESNAWSCPALLLSAAISTDWYAWDQLIALCQPLQRPVAGLLTSLSHRTLCQLCQDPRGRLQLTRLA